MSLSRITTQLSRTVPTQSRNSVLLFGRRESRHFQSLSNHAVSPRRHSDLVTSGQVSFIHHSALKSSTFQWFGYSSSASPETNEKETVQSLNEHENKEHNEAAADAPQQKEGSDSDGKPESDLESDLSRDDLVKLVMEKEEQLSLKQEELGIVKDKVLRAYAEMENVKRRAMRESENAEKFAIENFAKSLLDVAGNLGRASTAAKDSFSKIDTSGDSAGAVKQLKTLLEGVEMTEEQLVEVFEKFGLYRYHPLDYEFYPYSYDPALHSKPADHVAVVYEYGYILHGRVIRTAGVIRPAEVVE